MFWSGQCGTMSRCLFLTFVLCKCSKLSSYVVSSSSKAARGGVTSVIWLYQLLFSHALLVTFYLNSKSVFSLSAHIFILMFSYSILKVFFFYCSLYFVIFYVSKPRKMIILSKLPSIRTKKTQCESERNLLLTMKLIFYFFFFLAKYV
jgi:hypothetical protein